MAKGKQLRIGIAAAVVLVVIALFFVWPGGAPMQNKPRAEEMNGFRLGDATPHEIPLGGITMHSSRDAVPAIDEPKFVPMSDANLENDQKGVLVNHGGEQRFYPHTVLAWHEVVNDSFGSTPITVLFRPQDEASAVFRRQVDDTRLRFGVSGLRYDKDTLFYDIETDSLWQGISGKAVVGAYSGTQLEPIESEVLSAGAVREQYPLAIALSTDTGFVRDYKLNPFKED
jgi:hypothetical protein